MDVSSHLTHNKPIVMKISGLKIHCDIDVRCKGTLCNRHYARKLLILKLFNYDRNKSLQAIVVWRVMFSLISG